MLPPPRRPLTRYESPGEELPSRPLNSSSFIHAASGQGMIGDSPITAPRSLRLLRGDGVPGEFGRYRARGPAARDDAQPGGDPLPWRPEEGTDPRQDPGLAEIVNERLDDLAGHQGKHEREHRAPEDHRAPRPAR